MKARTWQRGLFFALVVSGVIVLFLLWWNQALLPAVRSGSMRVLKARLAEGADVNVTDEHGDSPLLAAAERSDPEMVRLLIEHGADLHHVDAGGRTALHRVAGARDADPRQQVEILELLIARGLDPTAREEHGDLPLHGAAYAGNATVVEFLLQRGVPVNATNYSGFTPLHHAAAYGDVEAVKVLIDAGAAFNAPTPWGATPLHRAASMGRSDSARALLEAGADPTLMDNHGRAPIDMARERKYEELVQMMEERTGEAEGTEPQLIQGSDKSRHYEEEG
ncbi:MAG: ankyrin repeat domain-containing protein [Candidatus Brocadiia bacterium]